MIMADDVTSMMDAVANADTDTDTLTDADG